MGRIIVLAAAVVWAAVPIALAEDSFPNFRDVVIDPHCGDVCYAVAAADVDADGKVDIVAVTENRVLWYQAPDWKPRVIIEDQTERDNVCIAPHDIDGDGKVDFAVGAGWIKTGNGTIQWLSRGESLDDRWHVHMIGAEKFLHRMRFADVLDTGKPQLVISPLNKSVANGVRLMAFEIPADPKKDRWPETVLDDTLNRMHNHVHADLDGDGSIDTLTASQEGVHVVRGDKDSWHRIKLNDGALGAKPEQMGAGEIKVGTLRSGAKYIATVEPMHGTSAVVYTSPDDGKTWTRKVIDDTLSRGHAVWCANLDTDEDDELIVGHSQPGPGPIKGPGLYVFDPPADPEGEWTKHVIDNGGIAVEDAWAADFTGDGKIDIVAGGRETHNVKLYVNGK